MLLLPPPILEERDGIVVVRDDLVEGGSKRRVLPVLMTSPGEYVYASPAYGYAQVAIAATARSLGSRKATIFVAKRSTPHPRTLEAYGFGAKIVQVSTGYLSNVSAKARGYAETVGATLLPFGLDIEAFHEAMADVARSLPVRPREVWSVVGSGALSRALQRAWPDAEFHAVRVGVEPDAGRAKLYVAPEKFEDVARDAPPFPSCANYDAKAWAFVRRHASSGALFWNVAA